MRLFQGISLSLVIALVAGCHFHVSALGDDDDSPTFRERLNLHRPQNLQLLHQSSLRAPGLDADQSGCGCYRVRNSYCCWQSLCVCYNVCYNGSTLLGNFRRQPCVAVPKPVGQKGQKGSPLKPITCRKTERFRKMLGIVLKEAPIPDGLGFRAPRWRQTRKSITWREGTTYLQPLDETTINIAHLWGKIGQLLLVNNASTVAPGLPFPVDRFMFPRHPNILNRMVDAGAGGWHINMMRQLVGLAARPMLEGAFLRDVPGLKPRRFAGKRPLLNGVVEFEQAFEAASEKQPLCFDRVIIPGILKAITYPSGADESLHFREEVRKDLRLELPPPPPGNSPSSRARRPVRVLYITRNSTAVKGRRCLTPESEAALLALLDTLHFKVVKLDFTYLTFREQFNQIMHAEIILGLHGAALVNAALARNRSVLFEVMPYRVFHQGYYFATVNSGASYFLHQVRQGTPQERDVEFDSLSVRACLNNPECKEYFMHHRAVELTREDLLDMGSLLMQARQLVVEARWNLMWAGRKLKRRYETLCTAQQRDIRCRMDLIRSPVADPNVECVVKKDCEGRAMAEEENLEEIL